MALRLFSARGPKAHGDMRVCLEARVVKDPREFAFGPGVVDQDRS
jgi:hypothetical protein